MGHALNVIAHNPEFMPETTIELGYTLQNYAEDNNKELNVIMTRLILSDGAAHALPIILRTYCPSEKIHIACQIHKEDPTCCATFQNVSDMRS